MDYTDILNDILIALNTANTNLQIIGDNVYLLVCSVWLIWIVHTFLISTLKHLFGQID